MPKLSFAPPTEELATEAAAILSAGWCRQRASIDNLAVDRQRHIIVRTNLAAHSWGQSAPSVTAPPCSVSCSFWPRSMGSWKPAG